MKNFLSQIKSNSIKTTENIPIHTKQYKYPETYRQEVQSQIQKMLTDDIIQHSNSPWSSPIWVIQKKKWTILENKNLTLL